ncbi:MAG TPA: SxtJ family membrane protein [Chitinophagaceae bacterium]|nr:SxtJ family membrane protein [Chitinophagaceae bacterium]
MEKERKKHLETILVLVLALLVIDYFWAYKKHSIDGKWMIFAMMALCAIGAFIPVLAKYIHIGWMKLGHAMGYVMSKVMLTLVYVIVVLPMSVFSRKKVTLQLKASKNSYFKERNHTYKKEDLENVW